MPRLSCWFIRAALLYLLIGATFGALILLHKGQPVYPLLWRLLPAHIEFMMFGWLVQLMLGVAFWIFPRFYRARGNIKPAWTAFVLLNIGLWLIALSPIFSGYDLLLSLGRLAEVGSVIAFAFHIWPRVKPPGVAT